jgi:8-oxo-dGTP pyrophosphatase MutT (NUDIX family)
MPREPWGPGETPEEEAARREAYERLAGAAKRVGMSMERLGEMLRQLLDNETETRRFLAEEVYGVPDEVLDDLLRIRLNDLREEEGGTA